MTVECYLVLACINVRFKNYLIINTKVIARKTRDLEYLKKNGKERDIDGFLFINIALMLFVSFEIH